MVVSGADARAKHLENLSDAAMVGIRLELSASDTNSSSVRMGWRRWIVRITCIGPAAPQTMDLGLLYKALEGNQVGMIAANATDGLLSKLDVKVLEDDKHAFPPYQVSIAAGQQRLQDTPGMREALAELSGKFTNQSMQQLNYQVDGEHRPVSQVAAEFLKEMYGPMEMTNLFANIW